MLIIELELGLKKDINANARFNKCRFSSWWLSFNPFEKYAQVKMGQHISLSLSPNVAGLKFYQKYLSRHEPAFVWNLFLKDPKHGSEKKPWIGRCLEVKGWRWCKNTNSQTTWEWAPRSESRKLIDTRCLYNKINFEVDSGFKMQNMSKMRFLK